MDRFLQEASTSYFWLAAVGVGVLVSLLSSLISKLAPRFGLSLTFWWKARSDKDAKNQSQRVKEIRAIVTVVAGQPALVSSFLIRAYSMFVCGAILCGLGLWSFFVAIVIDYVLWFGPRYSGFWWLGIFQQFSQPVFILTVGFQIFKRANERYLISTFAEEKLLDEGLKKLTLAALPEPRSLP